MQNKNNKVNSKSYPDIINSVKSDENAFKKFIAISSDGEIVKLLQKLGRFEDAILQVELLKLLKNSNAKIRALALKNLAKLGDVNLLSSFMNIALNDNSTDVRREAASAVGRLRSKTAKKSLIKLLDDKDPKVIQQAIRGLLVFKHDKDVKLVLLKMKSHPNDQIQDLINGFDEKEKKSNRLVKKNSDIFHNVVVNADTNVVMKLMPDEVIDLTFTSPPYYNARDYSIYSSYGEYLDFLREVFNNLLRITREGRFLVVNSSPVIVPRVSRAHASRRYPIPFDLHGILVQNGWEFIDDIIWVKPEASAKNRNAGFLQNRKPLAYKPNSISEMLMVYRKKTDKLIDWNIRQYPKEIVQKSLVKDGYETSNIWYVDPTFSKKHSAVFPKELCKKVIEYYSFIGDLVFDPFAGSGTLGKVAIECNRKFFLTEVDKNYFSSIKSLFTTPNLFQSDFDVAFFNQKSFRDRIDKNK
jgi:DNA modification methylase